MPTLLRAVDRAQAWASLVNWSTMEGALEQLRQTNALVSPIDEEGAILRDPPTMGQ